MPQFLFTYGVPTGYTPGGPDAMAAWKDWHDSLGGQLLNRVNPVSERTAIGNCGEGTQIGGYSVVTADDIDAAAALAKTCPAIDVGAGVEIGGLVELNWS